MSQSEAQSRIKINRLLEEAGWRFFDDANGSANIQLEQGTKITRNDIDAFGEDFEGLTDFDSIVDYICDSLNLTE